MKLTKRQKYIVDKLKSGSTIGVGANYVLLSSGFENEMVQHAFFFKMVGLGIIYQQTKSPFNWVLHPNYQD